MSLQNKRFGFGIELTLLALGLIVVVAAILRFVNLSTTPGWWPDEGVMLNIATNLSHGKMQMFSFTYPMNPHPPLFFLLGVPFIKIFGSSILSLRILSALLGTASTIIAFLIGRKMKNDLAGLLSALLVAVTPAIILTSRIALSYELLSTLYLLTLLLVLVWDQKKRDVMLVLASVVAGLCTITSYGGVVAIVFLLVFVAFRNWRKLPICLVFSPLPAVIYIAVMLALDRNAFLHDIKYMLIRPESQIGAMQILQSFKSLVIGFPVLMIGLIGFFFAKRKTGIFVLGFALLIALIEFKTRGYWWYMMTFLPIMTLGLSIFIAEVIFKVRIFRILGIIIATMTIVISLYQSLETTLVNKSFGLIEERIFSPEDLEKLKLVTNFVNDNTTGEDTVLSSAHISWMLHALPSDPILSYVSHNKSTTNFPDDMQKTGRFVYDPDFKRAKYHLEDKFMRNWFPGQPGIEENVLRPIHDNWDIIFDFGEFKLYANPELN